jgi:hypothetical protein
MIVTTDASIITFAFPTVDRQRAMIVLPFLATRIALCGGCPIGKLIATPLQIDVKYVLLAPFISESIKRTTTRCC